MSGRRLFSTNPHLGTTTYFHYNDADDSATFETLTEVDSFIDENKREFNDADTGWRGDMHKVASIPMTLYMDLQKQGILEDPKRLKAWLNDPENRYFRTKSGRV